MISAGIAAASALWIARTRVSELQYALSTGKRDEPVLLGLPRLRTPLPEQASRGVRFGVDGAVVPGDVGASILDLAEKTCQPIRSGCRMGVCGADPVEILDGATCLSAPGRDELATLQRLGMGGSARLACCARITDGVVAVSLTPGRTDVKPARYDATIRTVVIIGGGISGVTAADFIRRGHPDCEIVVVGQEAHLLYNRMEISGLLHGDSGVDRLHLMPDDWYRDNNITMLAGITAERIDPRSRSRTPDRGERAPLSYDRLILAMGARAAIPPVPGIDLPGSFVLRQADDTIRIRAHAANHGCRRAVVSGGGLLGLEAAFALQHLGLQVTLLVRGNRLLARQIDERCSALVADHLAASGIEVLFGAEAARLIGATSVAGVQCRDGRMLPLRVVPGGDGHRAQRRSGTRRRGAGQPWRPRRRPDADPRFPASSPPAMWPSTMGGCPACGPWRPNRRRPPP